MELDQATEQFYEKLSERLKEKGFSTRIIEDGCLEVTSEKIRRGILPLRGSGEHRPKQRFEHCAGGGE